MNHKLSFILIICIIIWGGCNSPSKYLNDALYIMEENSINKDSINWTEFREDVKKRGEKAQSIEETYPIIKYALHQLGDNHSFLFTVESQEKTYDIYKPLPLIRSELINDSIAYIMIPSFSGNEKLAVEFANKLDSIVNEFDEKYISGWIIDLSENGGGNMWPMLLGIGKLIETDTIGYFVDADSNYSSWIYTNGKVSIDNSEPMSLKHPRPLSNKNKKKAVLISGKTGSSGEAIAVAFKGSINTKFFGQNTVGLSTSNQGFELSDGAMIILTTSKFVDKNKNIYGTQIKPDYLGFNSKDNAIKWIMNEI